ncbi:MAG: bifunctional 4-hydroxy-3-methylbut-2-enyl diphosphate reductase/30S ribosomal protein S1, partial [Oscillospiraceae bacterium]|nr:bifunctional 4-hydroxy-3-methylbut-2-enyl diphosphate reductase/30S ribosomal protein S1 [Oscillospiraceae bacterium]
MNILMAKSAGFCFGVDKAVASVNQLLKDGQRVYTLGPIIHNPQVVEEFRKQGVVIVDSPRAVPNDAVLVIRSHGVSREIYNEIVDNKVNVCDATCPFVFKIHRIVEKESADGAVVIIAGNEGHPEVAGIRGHCKGPVFVISSHEDIEILYNNNEFDAKDKIIMVAQTTFNMSRWKKCSEIAKKLYTNIRIFDTICNATAERQNEAIELAKSSDLMVIVGGRESSNTAKLRDVCEEYCPTLLIETADELDPSAFKGVLTVGLTAGASTPSDIIKEVLSTMSEIVNNENEIKETQTIEAQTQEAEDLTDNKPDAASDDALQNVPEDNSEAASVAEEVESVIDESEDNADSAKSFEEMSFEEALEASLQGLSTDERVSGVVVGIAPNEVQVEVVGRKQTGYIPVEELSADPVANPEDIVKIGDKLDLLILRTNDQEGTIMLSKKRVDALKGWDTVVAAEQSGEALEGVVTDIVKGGMLVVTNNVRVFIPASHASAVRMEDLTPLHRQRVRFKIIETNKSRRRAVGSVRLVAREERRAKEAAFWESVEVGQRFTGKVKSLTSYGAFVDLGGVDGMVHISELSWERIKHPSDVVNVGDTVDVYIRDLDKEKKRISLGYRRAEDNPWEIFKANYPIGSVVKVKIVGMTSFGAFGQIVPGVDGLIHISQIADRRIDKPQDELEIGQEAMVKIINVDYERKRISLSIRALLEQAPAVTDENTLEPVEEQVESKEQAPVDD